MCGISGVLDDDHRPGELRDLAARMTRRLAHRGPDAEGVLAEDGIALGHRRLAILDLSPAGAQPMLSACGRWVVVYNGEIYNHLDLRRDLAAAGAAPAWRGHSDTETLLAGIAAWGLDATLTRAAGMFALALWDRRERRLMLARDRMGEKPLYWGWAGRALVFGSELKALAAHPDFRAGSTGARWRNTCALAMCPHPAASIPESTSWNRARSCSWTGHPPPGRLPFRSDPVSPMAPCRSAGTGV
jgi:asparagine synthase (glutamine-hydrolysing)